MRGLLPALRVQPVVMLQLNDRTPTPDSDASETVTTDLHANATLRCVRLLDHRFRFAIHRGSAQHNQDRESSLLHGITSVMNNRPPILSIKMSQHPIGFPTE